MPLIGSCATTRKQYPPAARSNAVNVSGTPLAPLATPAVAKAALAGMPAVSLFGAVAPSVQLVPFAVVPAPRNAFSTPYALTPTLVAGVVNERRTSSDCGPESRLPPAPATFGGPRAVPVGETAGTSAQTPKVVRQALPPARCRVL